MARVIAIIDSETGRLIDAVGNGREGARYLKFAKRMLSLDTPVAELDYGANGATKLDVSAEGGAGEEIVLRADSVDVTNGSGDAELKVNGTPIGDLIAGGGETVVDKIVGTPGEIEATTETVTEGATSKEVRRIALSQSVKDTLDVLEEFAESSEGLVAKEELGTALSGIVFSESDDLSGVISKLRELMNRLTMLAQGRI